jgi:alkyl hydroperoxide reductase subunit F
VSARTVIVASGKKPRELGLPRERDLIGRGLSYCATCDGPLFANADVAVVGGGNSAVQAVIEMAAVARKIYNISRSPWRADAVIKDKAEGLSNLEKRIGYDVVDIVGTSVVEGLRIRSRSTGVEESVALKGIFVEIGLKPNSAFLVGTVAMNERGEIVVNCDCETNVRGMFAAGDVTNVHEKQIVVAAGEGAKAALSAHEFLMRTPGFRSDGPSTW